MLYRRRQRLGAERRARTYVWLPGAPAASLSYRSAGIGTGYGSAVLLVGQQSHKKEKNAPASDAARTRDAASASWSVSKMEAVGHSASEESEAEACPSPSPRSSEGRDQLELTLALDRGAQLPSPPSEDSSNISRTRTVLVTPLPRYTRARPLPTYVRAPPTRGRRLPTPARPLPKIPLSVMYFESRKNGIAIT
ncbi:hypothetical protein B0H14DRAFT_2681465 [Mycena olivaceomarginata]|nr:hypothetical protein B0H14DRAFT_2681465 [Mycena olivaceomarginata]